MNIDNIEDILKILLLIKKEIKFFEKQLKNLRYKIENDK